MAWMQRVLGIRLWNLSSLYFISDTVVLALMLCLGFLFEVYVPKQKTKEIPKGPWYYFFVIAFYLPGGIPVFAFSLLAALGGAAGLAWVIWQAPEEKAPSRMRAGFWALFGGLVGGRIVYVLVYWPYYRWQWQEIWQVNLGGLAWPGALGGALLAILLYAWITRQSLGELADALLPLLLFLTVAAWLGCWLDGCAYGEQTTAWWRVPARDEWGEITPRFPLQAIGAFLTIMLFWSLERFAISSDLRPGIAASLGLLLMAVLSLGSSLLRADLAPLWHGLRMDIWASLGFLILAVLALFAFGKSGQGNERGT